MDGQINNGQFYATKQESLVDLLKKKGQTRKIYKDVIYQKSSHKDTLSCKVGCKTEHCFALYFFLSLLDTGQSALHNRSSAVIDLNERCVE